MKYHLAVVGGSAFALASCTTVPQLPSQYAVDASDIVNQVQCELRSASNEIPFLREKKGWIAAADLELKIAANAGFDASATFTDPIGTHKTFDGGDETEFRLVSIGGGFASKATRTVNFSFSQRLWKPQDIACNSVAKNQPGGQLLNGRLGIDDWLRNLARTFERQRVKPKKTEYTMEFAVNMKGNLGPTINAVPIANNTFNAGLNLLGDRQENHKLTLVITPFDDSLKEVIIAGYKTRKPTAKIAEDKIMQELSTKKLEDR